MRARALLVRLSLLGLFAIVGSMYFDSKTYAAPCAPTADYGRVTQTVTINTTGTYRIWSRIKAPDTTNNSYMLQIDGVNCFTVGDGSLIPANTWTWVNYHNGSANSIISMSLSAGSHNIVLIGSEPDVQLDRVIFTTDSSCIPNGTGDLCAEPPDTTPPTVSITSPSANSQVSGTTTVTATANDNEALASVEFFVDGNSIGSDVSSPFSRTFDASSLSVGNHTLTARARDTAGNTTTSGGVTVARPDTIVPTVSITSPATGTTVSGTISVAANAADNVGVTSVEFFVDGVSQGSDTSSPYGISLNTVSLANGSRSLTARAYDAANLSTTSTAIAINVNNPVTPPPDTTPPAVSITNPSAGAILSGTVDVTATATDNVGVARVEFYVDGQLANTDTAAPYSFQLNTTTLQNGNHSFSARAYDTSNRLQNSTAITAAINNQTYIPEDINQDTHVNVLDFTLLVDKLWQTTSLGRADINRDGAVDLLDFTLLVDKFGT